MIETAIKEAEVAGGVEHAGMIGRIREIAIKNLFRPLLTKNISIGYGKIVDSFGVQSKETDVILYSKDILPAILFSSHEDIGLFPVEACIYAIEVKSKATATELKDAIEKARSLRELKYAPGIYDIEGRSIQHRLTPVIPAFFAFDSDLKGDVHAEINRYAKIDKDGDFNPLIPVMCIVGKGYWYYRRLTTPDNDSIGKWWFWKANEEHDEVIAFLGAILNTIPDSIALRGHPKFGEYVIQNKGEHAREVFWKFDENAGKWIKRNI
ncbi:hypothetical protein P0O15_08405 [Methanotrichaceae archaeon Mx]|uniref:DUF6602 domain-containing protein n=2 Tax=Candidatus Methanocrinis natronophilus TaxID=3033396 RepID=A0ABT5X925_9EURY|nr:hypothetical protein [Candidatus Methanocrinis natronophilus]